jgi:hypothetical protein
MSRLKEPLPGVFLVRSARIILARQTDFSEPLVRINTDRVHLASWSEAAAWDGVISYYAA